MRNVIRLQARLAIQIGIVIAITGCTGMEYVGFGNSNLAKMSPEELKSQGSTDLCKSYANSRDQEVRAEILRREEIPERDWIAISAKKIQIGMSELGLICSWGTPGIWGDINTSTGRWGTHRQWVYRSCDMCDATYVYTENGKVTSWSD